MKVQLFNVSPSVPEKLRFIEDLARNMWWCWQREAVELFRRISPELWRETGHNPLAFLDQVPQKRLELLATDEGFLGHLEQVRALFEAETKGARARTCDAPGCNAYFSLEYGLHESVRLYSGGLGVLAGDHLKAASDMDLPLVAVGLLYRQGYFQQYLNRDGWQQEHYPDNEIQHLPVVPALRPDGSHLQVTVPMPGTTMHALVWRLAVGRISLYLLDTNIADNTHELRRTTDSLYGGDKTTRLRQELLLGIGGYRALATLGYHPHACHINEGHAAFLSLARMEHLVEDKGLTPAAAREIVRRTNIFTTHTPVPAGNETFHLDILRPHLDAIKDDLKIDPDDVVTWGWPDGTTSGEFSMTVLGLRMSSYCNGVSKLHGDVARDMWAHLWPEHARDEVPVRHITNGVHVPSWISTGLSLLFDRYLGTGWRSDPGTERVLSHIESVPDEELWRAHELSRSRLIRAVRELTEKQYRARNASRSELGQIKSVLDHDALTIGFARRFATYKRATLLLSDPQRLEALLSNEERPVQIVFAGKAHPADNHGKDLIRQVIHFAQRANVRRRVVFLEDYNIYTARRLVQGVDVWLNTPRRPQEASGTSGMKAAINGGLNLSVLDGWWCEGYDPSCGWAIGTGDEYDDPTYQDTVEAQALYNLLENEVVPRFYDRPSGDLPREWIQMMKSSIRMALGFFTSHRMVSDYNDRFYAKAIADHSGLCDNEGAAATAIVAQQARLASHWSKVRIEMPSCDKAQVMLRVGDRMSIETTVHLADLKPEEVLVQVYYGPVNSENSIIQSHVEAMEQVDDLGGGTYRYRHEVSCGHTGRFGFTARVTPRGKDYTDLIPGYVTWANGG